MAGIHRIIAAAAAFASLLMPTMLCAMPGSQMTAAEHSCCKQMKGNCGGVRMPASHSCFQTTMESSRSDLAQPQSAVWHVPLAVSAATPQASISALPLCGYLSVEKLDHSPPLRLSSTSVLRI